MDERITLRVNGEAHAVLGPASRTLLEVLREDLDLTGTKHGCELGECGACTVLLDGAPALSCLVLAVEAGGREITTIEGLGDAGLHPVQRAFVDAGALQCGYCTPGFVLAAAALLVRNPTPTRAEIADALSGNLCRCTGYQRIIDAVESSTKIGIRDQGSGIGS